MFHPCQNNGSCTNKKGSYVCDCSIGWQGTNCEEGIQNAFVYTWTFSLL